VRIRLNKLHFPVTVLGPGRRMGVWVQGCTIGCRGCLSRDTWAPDGGREVEVEVLAAWCRDIAEHGADGLTITGGEPFEQALALDEFLDAVGSWRGSLAHEFDVLCYSGFPLTRLRREHASTLAKLDAVIPEPFIQRLPRGNVWRGSSNQPLVPLSDLGRVRYSEHIDRGIEGRGKLQVHVTSGRVWYIGIPDRDDMDRQMSLSRDAGLILKNASWLP
jgi:anaerobic ribonucleoside-triphosphate reductase activating protein